MTREESIKLLALIKVAYPSAYRDIDRDTKMATINMWQMTFPKTPLVVMEMAFDRFRRKSKFAPTVAEIIDELRGLHYIASLHANAALSIGDRDTYARCAYVADSTEEYKETNETVDYTAIDDRSVMAYLGEWGEGNETQN